MEKIKTDRVLEIVATKVLERTRAMSSLAEKQLLVDKIRDKAWYDDKQKLVSCCATEHKPIQKDFPTYPFLVLERVYGEDDKEYPEQNDDELYGWILWCFDSLEELRKWFQYGLERDLDIGYVEAIYMMDIRTYKEVPTKYYVEVKGKKFYITPLSYWDDEDVEPIYDTIGMELVGVAEVYIEDKVSYHLCCCVEDVRDRVVLNELAEFAVSGKQGEEKGYFIYEGQKHPFVFNADARGAGVTFFTPDGKEVEDMHDFLSSLKVENDKVLVNLQD